MIIGSNKAKNMIIQQGITPRLIQLLDDPIGGDDLKLEGKFWNSFWNTAPVSAWFCALSDSGNWIPCPRRREPHQIPNCSGSHSIPVKQ